ncbi:hypothetical protein FACS1894156_7470 [Bacteroidia bacterium]|nr:hypothetical protein FACS1894156_7470 [Bacteroidia bacterium]
MYKDIQTFLQKELAEIESAGLCKNERVITSATSNKDIPLDALSGNIALTRSGKHIISFVNEKDGAGADSVTIYRTDANTGAASPIFTGKYKVRGISVNLFTGSIYLAAEQDGASVLLLINETGELLRNKATGVGTKQFRFFTRTYAL